MDILLVAATAAMCVVAVTACAVLCQRAERAAAKAVEFADAADIDASSARSERNRAAECAEVVKTEVAKLETLVSRLNRERAENPPCVAITYSEDTGDPVRAVVVDPAAGADWQATAPAVPTARPFAFAFGPTPVHPTIVESSE